MMKKWCDGKLMRLISFSAILLFGKLVKAEPHDKIVSWYVNGQKQVWQKKTDVAAYKIPSDTEVPKNFPADIIKDISLQNKYAYKILRLALEEHDAKQYFQLNEIISKQNQSIIPLFTIQKSAPLENKYSAVENKEIIIDNQLLVQFNQPYVSDAVLQQFMSHYHLELIHKPSEKLNNYGKYTYIFAIPISEVLQAHPATMAGKIYEENIQLIDEVLPNMLNVFVSDNEENDFAKSGIAEQNIMNTAWHLGNKGQTTFCSTQAQQTADTQIDDVWDLGYKGQEIKVGIIDVHGFDFNHPAMKNQFLPGWNFINNQPYNAQNFFASSPTQSHGMAVAGIIAANGDAKGVAYEAKVVPFLVDLSEASIIQALQKAMQPGFDVDVLNCSFSGTGNNPLIEDEIANLTAFGRNRFGNNLGVIIVCSSGNNNTSDEETPMYPAAYEQVISVTATTPLDKRKEINDQWNTGNAWAPNYGRKLHVGAPGLCIPTTDFSGSTGYSQANYITFSKTSSAAPVVSGLVALLLSKNQSLNWQEVKQKIADGADKVGGYNYNYDGERPGHSKETGYGRINAYKTLDAVSVGVEKVVANAHKINIKVENPVNQELNIHYDVANNHSDIEMRIFNAEGKLFYYQPLNIAEKHVTIDVANLPAGMYFSKFFIRDEEEDYLETVKFVKLW